MPDLDARPEENTPDASSVTENEVPAAAEPEAPAEPETAAEPEAPAEPEPVTMPQGIDASPVPEPAKKSRKGLIAGLIIGAAALAAGGFVYGKTAEEYKTKYLPGTVINGIGVGDLAPADIEERFRLSSENYSLTVKFRGGTESLKGSDFDYRYVSSGETQQILDEQNPLMWGIASLGRGREYTVTLSTDFDRKQLEDAVRALPELQPENEIPPENAGLRFEEDGTFSIVPEVAGTTADADAVVKAVLKAADKRASLIDLTIADGIYEAPVVFADNPDLISQRDNLNAFLDTRVTYILPDGKTETLDRGTLRNWVSREDNGFYYIDPELVSGNVISLVHDLAQRTNVLHETRAFNSTAHGQVEVPCDPYGIVIDEAAESDQLFSELMNHTSAEREPVYSQKVTSLDPNIGGTYIEVDISGQHVYYYRDGALVLDTPCVSGTYYDPSHRTPCGVYSIYYMEQDRTLHGTRYPDGSYEYSSFVNYWMPFYQGCGLHDATWRGEFGGSIYLTSGSHGCVNLPLDKAKALYESIYVGLPVIVFYAG